ncbi:hypothetical protein [Kibdelosporangium phytohabitans]|uniref:hypothetical protein n=1 Tax=Kibdelosporangium phytohabitans TaxID=860235 RepID=UPI0019E20C25|nr:cation diffusion facilitator CzcD-associated flavoprotein CzcO [Kibdelosporangium phytohabitans]
MRTASGETFQFGVLIPAVGQLSRPSGPGIPGIADFRAGLSTPPSGTTSTT